MNTKKYIGEAKQVINSGSSWNVYSGLDGYVVAMLVRMNSGEKLVRQMINGQAVVKYHQATDMWVKDIIKQRVGLGMSIKNLVCYEDRNLEIEKSDRKTLKESRLLSENEAHQSLVAVFGDYVTILELTEDISESKAVIIKNKSVASAVELLFDEKWRVSKAF